MKLGVIDYQFPRGGAERFVLGVFDNLPPEIEVTVFSTGAALVGYRELISAASRSVGLVDRPVLMHQSAAVADGQAVLSGPQIFDVPAELWTGLDLVWFPWVNRHLVPRECLNRTVATIHDMIIVELGEFMAGKRETVGRVGHFYSMAMEDMLVRRLMGSLAKVMVDTERTRDHLARTYGPLTREPEVVPLSTEHMRTIRPEPIDHLGLPERFVLYPANYSSHKNHEALFVALAKVKEERPDAFLPLVLTGGSTPNIASGADYRGAYLKALVEHLKLEIGRDILICGVLSDGQFRSLLSRAAGLVFPTLLEGFGFPPLEAGLLGIPVACSDIAVLRETMLRLNVPALWFDPRSPTDIAAALIRIATDAAALQAAAIEAAATFDDLSWADVGARYLQAFRDQAMLASLYDGKGS
jgi:glycosyltransferase involved in cell wall biosynthesis